MAAFDRHDAFAGKNAALSRAYEMDAKKKAPVKAEKGEAEYKDDVCSICQERVLVRFYKKTITKRNNGGASISHEKVAICDACLPKKKATQEKSPAQIKSMMKAAKKSIKF